jgi:hypothetical protein
LRAVTDEVADQRRVRRLVADDRAELSPTGLEQDAAAPGGEIVRDLAQIADERQLVAQRDELAERYEVLLGVDGEESPVGPVGKVGVVEQAVRGAVAGVDEHHRVVLRREVDDPLP